MSITSLPKLTGNFGSIYNDFSKWERYKKLLKLLAQGKIDEDKCVSQLQDLGLSKSQAENVVTQQLSRLEV